MANRRLQVNFRVPEELAIKIEELIMLEEEINAKLIEKVGIKGAKLPKSNKSAAIMRAIQCRHMELSQAVRRFRA